MGTIRKIGWAGADPGTWRAVPASLLLLWLLFGTMQVFPLPAEWACALVLLAFVASFVLLWKGRVTFEVILYSLFPLLLIFLFEEISATYKMPFLLTCVLLLSLGILGYHWSLYKDSPTLAWLILLSALVVTWVLASHAVQNYWQMAGELGYVNCSPDAPGCAPLAGRGTPWWILFFRL